MDRQRDWGRVRSGSFAAVLALSMALASPLAAQDRVLMQSPLEVQRGQAVLGLAIGDLHGDGRQHVVAMVQSPSAAQATIVIEEHIEDAAQPAFGRLRPVAVLPADVPVAVLLVDIDGDGDLDILVAQDRADDALVLWINQSGVQGGARGSFRRSAERLAYDMAVGLLALPRFVGSTPDLVLLRGLGRPAVLLRETGGALAPAFSELQLFGFGDAAVTGGLSTDVDGDGREDLILYGNGCWLWLGRGPSPNEPQFEYAETPLGDCAWPGLAVAGAAIALQAPRRTMVLLAGADGRDHRLLLSLDPPLVQHQELTQETAGQTRAFGFLDVDGDGQSDLIAVRANHLAPAAQRGSLVHRRQGDGFPGILQRIAPGWGLAMAPLRPTTPDLLWLAGWIGESSLWLPAVDQGLTPSLQFGGAAAQGRPMGYFEPGRIGEVLAVTPFATGFMQVSVEARGPGGALATGNRVLAPGMAQASGSQPAAIEPGEWQLEIIASSPPGSSLPGHPQIATAVMMPDRDEGSCPFCVKACVVVGDCRCIVVEGDPRGATLSGQFMGTLAELQQLRRLRDERLLETAAGRHYVDLYLALQQDLYTAIFAEPRFYFDLWQLKDGWMPALHSLLDGDGSHPVDAAMQQQLSETLSRMAALASPRLREAIDAERRALGLDQLQDRPIAELQARWEDSPLFADGFQ